MLKKFDMNNAKPIKMPMPSNGHLDLNEEGKSIDQKVYRSMIGSLLYLCASRPDIMLSVCMCARFQANPKECHLMTIKRIFIYLVHTPNLGLWYPKGSVTYQKFDCFPMCEFSQKFKTFCVNMLATKFDPNLLASHLKFLIK
jgi:hypothetical protein